MVVNIIYLQSSSSTIGSTCHASDTYVVAQYRGGGGRLSFGVSKGVCTYPESFKVTDSASKQLEAGSLLSSYSSLVALNPKP